MFSSLFRDSLGGNKKASRRLRPSIRLSLEQLEDRTLLSTAAFGLLASDRTPRRSLTEGPDGNVWICEYEGDAIARVTPSGVVTQFALPQPDSLPHDITVGPDGNLWFSEPGVNKIADMNLNGVVLDSTR